MRAIPAAPRPRLLRGNQVAFVQGDESARRSSSSWARIKLMHSVEDNVGTG